MSCPDPFALVEYPPERETEHIILYEEFPVDRVSSEFFRFLDEELHILIRHGRIDMVLIGSERLHFLKLVLKEDRIGFEDMNPFGVIRNKEDIGHPECFHEISGVPDYLVEYIILEQILVMGLFIELEEISGHFPLERLPIFVYQ